MLTFVCYEWSMLLFCLLPSLLLLLLLLLFIVAWLSFFVLTVFLFDCRVQPNFCPQVYAYSILLGSTMPKKGEAFFFFFTLYIQYPKTVHREWNVYTRKQLKVNLKSTVTAGVKTASYAGGLSDCHAIFLPSLCDELKEHLRRRVESHGIRPNSLL